jgi:cytochrome c556
MKITLILSICAAACVLVACSDAGKDTHPDQLVTKRQAIFKKFTKALEPMGLVARDRNDYVKTEFMANAQALQELSKQPWVYFSTEGNYQPSRAKPEVWTQADDFKKAQTNYLTAVDQLVAVSGSADMPKIKNAVDEVQKGCKTCHDQFRLDRK